MKKKILVWLVLLVMAFSSEGYAAGNAPRLGSFDGEGKYSDGLFGFTVDLKNWKVETHLDTSGIEYLVYAVSPNGYQSIQLSVTSIGREPSEAEIPEMLDGKLEILTKGYEARGIKKVTAAKDTIVIAGEKRPCITAKYTEHGDSVYETYIYYLNGEYLGVVVIVCRAANKTKDMLAKFKHFESAPASTAAAPAAEEAAVSAADLTEENIEDVIGNWDFDAWAYTIPLLGLKFHLNSWFYYDSHQDLAARDEMTEEEWLASLSNEWAPGGYKEGDFKMVMRAGTISSSPAVDISMAKLLPDDEFTDERLNEYMAWLLEDDVKKSNELGVSVVSSSLGTVSFMGEEKPCIKIQDYESDDPEHIRYYTGIPLVKDGYIVFIEVYCLDEDKVQEVLAKFRPLNEDSSIDLSEEDVARIIGDWTEEEGKLKYINEQMNFQFELGDWTEYEGKEHYAKNKEMHEKEWLDFVKKSFERYDYINSVKAMLGRSRDHQQWKWVTVWISKIADYEPLTEEMLPEFLSDYLKIVRKKQGQTFESIDGSVETITFLKEEKPCLRVKLQSKQVKIPLYTTYIPIIQDGFLVLVDINSAGNDDCDIVADKFSPIK